MKKKNIASSMRNNLPIALLICHDPVKISFFKDVLKGSFSLILAEDSDLGVEWLQSSPIEIVILDSTALNTPLENICKEARKTTKIKNIPILLISNSLDRSFILHALNAGVSDFLADPLSSEEVHTRIAVSLHSKLINKKMRFVQNKIKTGPLIPKSTKILKGRTFMREKTLQTIVSAKKGAIPLSVLMVHVDDLPRLQEMCGIAAIQEVLNFIETFLKTRLRKYDTLTSEGPGQYLVMLPKTSQSAAKVIAEDIRKEISHTIIKTSVKEVLTTLSIGLVSFEKELSKTAKDFEQFDLCLERVKKSLVRAQKKGSSLVSQNK